MGPKPDLKHLWERRTSCSCLESQSRPICRLVRSLVTILTELFWLTRLSTCYFANIQQLILRHVAENSNL
jgi:hypothetical protein